MTDQVENLRNEVEQYLPEKISTTDRFNPKFWHKTIKDIPLPLLREMITQPQHHNWNPWLYREALTRVATEDHNIDAEAPNSVANIRITMLNLLNKTRYFVEVNHLHVEFCKKYYEGS